MVCWWRSLEPYAPTACMLEVGRVVATNGAERRETGNAPAERKASGGMVVVQCCRPGWRLRMAVPVGEEEKGDGLVLFLLVRLVQAGAFGHGDGQRHNIRPTSELRRM